MYLGTFKYLRNFARIVPCKVKVELLLFVHLMHQNVEENLLGWRHRLPVQAQL